MHKPLLAQRRAIDRQLKKAPAGAQTEALLAQRQAIDRQVERINAELAAAAGEKRKPLNQHKNAIYERRRTWQYTFDETMRTPAGAEAQQIWVHGGKAKPYHETRPGPPWYGSFAKPDYTVMVSTERGGITRFHVNLKSHDLSKLTLAAAEDIAKDVTKQAFRNGPGDPAVVGSVGHLPAEDRIVISFIDQPDRAIQKAMTDIMFAEKSPISEVQFGHANHRKGGPLALAPPPKGPVSEPAPAAHSPGVGTESPPAKGGQPAAGTPAPAAPATGARIAPQPTKGGAPVPPTPAAGVAGAGVDASVPKQGSLKSGPVTADYDLTSTVPKVDIKVSNIDLSDFPPDRPGPVTRFFDKGPEFQKVSSGVQLTQLFGSLVAEASSEETAKKIKWFVEPIQSWFRMKIADARTEFRATFPDPGVLWSTSGVDRHRQAYEEAAAMLRLPTSPGAKRNRAAEARALGRHLRGVRGNVKAFGETAAAYEDAMLALSERLGEPLELIQSIAPDIRQRAAVLGRAGKHLQDAFWGLVQSPIALHPLILSPLYGIHTLGGIFQGLGDNMAGFAAEIQGTLSQYELMEDNLHKELARVVARMNDLGIQSPRETGGVR